jgi:WD40 repeat protein
VNESESIDFNNKIIYNSNQNVICSNYNSNRSTIKVNTSYNRATQKCKINQLPSQTHISIDEQKEIESNLKTQQFQSQIITKQNINEFSLHLEYKSTLQGHQNKVITIIFFNALFSSSQENKLASGGYDNSIKIWNSKPKLSSNQILFNYELEKTFYENNYVFTLLEFEPNLILSSTADNVINLWSLYINQQYIHL